MSNDTVNQISISIKDMLSDLSNSTTTQCIFKVHDRLRNHNKEAYEPQVLSIGPYHHDKCNLKKMETYKLRYLQGLLLRRQEENADRYIMALMELKDQARGCYAEEISLKENDFVKMLCVDGIFIIEFLRRQSGKLRKLHNGDDNIFEMDWLIVNIERDLVLFENQIPFFVLTKLFDMTKLDDDNLINLARHVCEVPFDFDPSETCTSIPANEVIHLLDLRYKCLGPSFDAVLEEINNHKNDDDKSWCPSFDAILKKITRVEKKDLKNKLSRGIKSASQLRQSGIKFERAKQQTPWLHITIKNGKIKIPHLRVEDHTESIFRNLMAFEQYNIGSQRPKFVTDYVNFLDNLINSPRDVEKLCRYGILTNWLGEDEVVATMFNKLVRDITVDEEMFCYSKVYKEVNKHAGRRWNIWKAHFMRNYFNTPWSVISFLAAVVLLILTFVQTILSILAVGKN